MFVCGPAATTKYIRRMYRCYHAKVDGVWMTNVCLATIRLTDWQALITLRTCTCTHVPLRTNRARLDLCVVLRDFCCNFTQYRAVSRSISATAATCVHGRPRASTVHARAWSYVRARGSACVLTRLLITWIRYDAIQILQSKTDRENCQFNLAHRN